MLQTLPVIPLRGMVVLPGEVVHCDAGRKKTLSAIQAAASGDGIALFVAQKDAQENDPEPGDLEAIGTIARIKQVFRIQGDGIHMLLTGISRADIRAFTSEEPYFEASVQEKQDIPGRPEAVEALRRRVHESFEEYTKLNTKLTSSQKNAMEAILEAGEYADSIAALILTEATQRQRILEEANVENRLMLLARLLSKELEVLRLDAEISGKLHEEIEKSQKEHYLREKLRVIRRELGDDGAGELDDYRTRMEAKEYPTVVTERLKKEIGRLESLPAGSHEAPMTRNYIELLLDLPWTEQTTDHLDLAHARKVLDLNHYGMGKVKDRIVEFLAVQKLTGKPNGQILCFVGPPGVGKTSIVASIAEAMGRKFVRMSLGGIRDEAEIRGHRRTYIGALPGRIISAMRQAGAVNPVLLFDEIDKLASDYRGDPASAMLEV